MIIFFILLGFLPSFAWLMFFLKEDIHPEPKKMIAKVFFYGALITPIAIALQYGARYTSQLLNIGQYTFLSFLIFAAIEEIMKFYVTRRVIAKSEFFDEPVDAMIYMISTALGFALVENIVVLINIQILSTALGLISLRFVGATLLHTLSSGLVGYYWARSLSKIGGRLSIVNSQLLILGLIVASALHAIFNYLIILQGATVYPLIFLIGIAFFIFWDFEKIKT